MVNHKGTESWHGLDFAGESCSISEGSFVGENKISNENFNNMK
jgi:hypothetical protein